MHRKILFVPGGPEKDGLCGHHRAMFADDYSAEDLFAEALPRRRSGKRDGIDLAKPEIVTEILNGALRTKIGKLVPKPRNGLKTRIGIERGRKSR